MPIVKNRENSAMKHLLLVLTMLIAGTAFSQTEDIVYEYQKGKKYIVHIVQAGNGLWGLQETYNVPAKEIIAANPGSEKGIQAGQKLLIPKGAAEAKYPDGTLIKEHVVVKGETLFNLAKKEKTTVEAITKLNPGSEAGLKLGQVVRIPVQVVPEPVTTTTPPKSEPAREVETTVSFSDTIILHTVLDHETLYSISKRFMVPVEDLQKLNKLKNNSIKPGQVLQIPLKKEQVKQVEIRKVVPAEDPRKADPELLFKKKEEYQIAVMLPFFLDGGDASAQALKEVATEFYMGVEMAIDSLKELGFNAKVYIYDVKNDSATVMAVLKKPEMKQMDLIFGPLIPLGADVVASWCKANKIRMVCPSACNASVMKSNPYVYAAIPSDVTLQRILARYTVENHSKDQIVLVNTGIVKDKELYDAFRERFIELSKAKANTKLIEIKPEDLAAYIRKNGNTVFVVPTRDRAAAMKFMSALQKSGAKAGNGTISVFGTKDWAGFEDIKGGAKNKYNLHWASANDLNYTLPETKNLLRQYRRKYKADLSKYAHGFDVMFYFSRTLLMGKESGQGVINSFDLEQVGAGNGYENNQAYILRHVDYELVRIGTVNE
jgi:LysM repeat protein